MTTLDLPIGVVPPEGPAGADVAQDFWSDRSLGENLVLLRAGPLYVVVQRVPLRGRAFWSAREANAFARRRFDEEREEVFLECLHP